MGILLGLLLILAVVAVALSVRYVYQRAGDESATGGSTISSGPSTSDGGGQGSSTTTSEAAASTSTTATTGGGAGTLVDPADVGASSSLPPEGGKSYSPRNLVDGDIATAWSEGVEGAGEGEWIQVQFDPPVTLTALEIANGYQKDRRRFEGNPRVLELRMKYSDGTTQNVRLYDDQGWQFITPEPVSTSSLRLTIVSVYPGDTWDDTSLSEIRIFGRE